MWTCVKCRERVDDEFEVCWRCGTSREGIEDPTFLSADAEDVAAPEEEPLERIEGFQDLVTVGTFRDLPEAHALKMRLEAAGIPAYLADAELVAMDWLLSNAVGGVKVQVA